MNVLCTQFNWKSYFNINNWFDNWYLLLQGQIKIQEQDWGQGQGKGIFSDKTPDYILEQGHRNKLITQTKLSNLDHK